MHSFRTRIDLGEINSWILQYKDYVPNEEDWIEVKFYKVYKIIIKMDPEDRALFIFYILNDYNLSRVAEKLDVGVPCILKRIRKIIYYIREEYYKLPKED